MLYEVITLAVSGDGLGFVNAVPDSDGIIRRVPLFIRYGGTLYPSLALTTYMRSRNSETVMVQSDSQGLISIKAGDTFIPVDKHGFASLRFRGPSKTYTYISAAEVLDGKISPDIFNQKIVFVGSSAEGLRDRNNFV